MSKKVSKMVKMDPIRELLRDVELSRFIAHIAAEPGHDNVTLVVLRKAAAGERDAGPPAGEKIH